MSAGPNTIDRGRANVLGFMKSPSKPTPEPVPESETEIALVLRFGLLFALGIGAMLVFYWALLSSAQVVALNAGKGASEARGVAMGATAGVVVCGALPILRFTIAELPAVVASWFRDSRERMALFFLILVGSVAILLA